MDHQSSLRSGLFAGRRIQGLNQEFQDELQKQRGGHAKAAPPAASVLD
jgi:hypothetical protein